MNELKLVFVTENGVKYLQTNETYAEENPFQIYDLGDVCLFAAEKSSPFLILFVSYGQTANLSAFDLRRSACRARPLTQSRPRAYRLL